MSSVNSRKHGEFLDALLAFSLNEVIHLFVSVRRDVNLEDFVNLSSLSVLNSIQKLTNYSER